VGIRLSKKKPDGYPRVIKVIVNKKGMYSRDLNYYDFNREKAFRELIETGVDFDKKDVFKGLIKNAKEVDEIEL
jgi:hypothetical protein